MIRALLTLLGCAFAIFAADILFRRTVLESVRPVILAPPAGEVLAPPVHLEWLGPRSMRVLLTAAGSDRQDLGVNSSPFTLPAEKFPREGSYEVRIESPRFGSWVAAHRTFQIYVPPAAPAPAEITTPPADPFDRPVRMTDLLRALRAARTAREKANDRVKNLMEENSALREESERLVQQLEALSDNHTADADQIADLERRLALLVDENRILVEEMTTLRMRLSSVSACTIWGYYSFPRPNTVPVTRRLLLISDLRGMIFRTQPDCEVARRTDSSAGSLCFCVGNAWG